MNRILTAITVLLSIVSGGYIAAGGDPDIPVPGLDIKSRLVTSLTSIEITQSIDVTHLFRLLTQKAGVDLYLHECPDARCSHLLPAHAIGTNVAVSVLTTNGNVRLKFKVNNVSCLQLMEAASEATGLKFSIGHDGVVLHIPPVESSGYFLELQGGPYPPPFTCGTFSGENVKNNNVSNQAIGAAAPQPER